MKKKLIWAIVLSFICAFCLFSCSFRDKKNEGAISGDNVIFDASADVTIVCGEGFSESHKTEVYNLLLNKANSVTILGSGSPKASREIVFGRTDREVSKKAYRAMELYDGEEGEVGYCIYSDGQSVAVAFDDEIYGRPIAENAVYDIFLEKYLSGSGLVLEEGIYELEKFDPIKYQESKDEAELDKKWEELSKSLAEKYGEASVEMVASLKRLRTIYTDDLVEWFANLYDPVTGGFYYSNSARNSEGYLPDLESTNQALGFLTSSGITDNMADFIPKDMQQQIVSFVKAMQNPKNGYFYHPQWGEELTDKNPARKGRDVGNATRLLSYFGAIPTYDAPNGVKGEYRRGTTPSASLPGRLAGSTVSAVSKVIPTADAGVEDWLLNEENFRNFLKKYDEKIKTDAYWVGNEFESLATQIVARDKELKESGERYSLCKIAVDWFISHLDPETGLWEPYENNEYDCVNGILKCSSAISKMGYPVPGALNFMEYAMQAITSTADPHHVCCVLNTWYALSILTANIKAHSDTAEEDIANFNAKYIGMYPQLVDATREKFSLFLKNTGTSVGAFSYFQKTTSPGSQGMPVALDNANEGDVNSSYICSAGVSGHIWGFIGESAIPLYTTSDGMRFLKVIESLGPIVKDKEIEAVTIDFEDVDSPQELLNSNIIDYWLPGGELAIEGGKVYGEGSKVMRFTSRNTAADELHIRLTKAQGTFNSIAYQSDIMFDPNVNTTYKLLFFGSTSTVRAAEMYFIAKPGDGIYVSVVDTDKTVKIADCGEWFKLRVEYARLTASKIVLDIIVNNRLVATSAVPYGIDSLPVNSVTRVRFATEKAGDGDMYIDNLFLEQCNKKLPDGIEEETGPSEGETGIATFDNRPIGAYYNLKWMDKWIPDGSDGSIEIVDSTPYGKASKVLALTTSGKNSDLFQFFITKTEEKYNAVGIQTDVMFDTQPGSSFRLLIFGDSSSKGYELLISTESDGVYISGPGMKPAKIAELKEWFNLQFGYAKLSNTQMYVAVIVNNKVVGESMTPINAAAIPEVSAIKRIQFSSNHAGKADGSVYFDNMIMAQLTYALPEVEPEPEPDPDAPVVPKDPDTETYENDDALDKFKFNNWNGGDSAANTSWYGIVNGTPYGKSSKVYGYETVSGYKPEVTFQFTPNGGANFASYESDMMLTTDGTLRPEFQIRTGDNKEIFLFYMEVKDGKVNLLDTDKAVIAELADDGEWFKFGVKATNYEGKLLITFYLNGERIKTGFKYTASGVANTVGRLRFWTETFHMGFMYFDNTKVLSTTGELETIDPDEVVTTPTEPDPEPSNRETYEDGDTINVFTFDNWNGGDAAENTSWYGITDGTPYGEGSKVYGYKTVAGYKPEVSFKFSSSPEANYTFFESDMMLTTDGVLCPEFQIRTAGNIELFKFYLKSDGEKVYLLDEDSNQLAELAKDGEWFRFGVKGSNYQGAMAITFYLNGERLDTGLHKTGGNAYAFERVRFWTEVDNVGEIYFDNTEITCSKETFIPPASDDSDDSNNPYGGDTNVGDNDWT